MREVLDDSLTFHGAFLVIGRWAIVGTLRRPPRLARGHTEPTHELIAVLRGRLRQPHPLRSSDDVRAESEPDGFPYSLRCRTPEAGSRRADPQETRIALEEARVLAALRSLGVRRRPTQSRRSDLLSARETQVLEHLVRGATTQQIANALFVSPHTVVSHVRHIYAKLGVNSRKELVARHAQR